MQGPAAYLNAHNEADTGIHQHVERAKAAPTPILATTPTPAIVNAKSCFCIGWWSTCTTSDEWR